MRKILVLVGLLICILYLGNVYAAEPIKIGAIYSLSGPAAAIGTPTKLVTQMVVEKINKEGGINGRPIELVVGDTESDPTKAVMVIKKFINVDKVAAIIGPDRTDLGMAVKKLVEDAGVPTFMTVGGDPVIMSGGPLGTCKWVFKSPQRSSVAVEKLYDYLKKANLKKVALITAADGFGKDGKGWLEKLAPKYGLTIVANESFNPKDTDMTAQLTKLSSAKPDSIVCWTIGPAAAIVAKNVKQLNLKEPLFQCHGIPDPKYVELAGPAAEGSIMPSTKLMAWEQLPDSDPQKQVIKDFVHLYNDVYKINNEFPINTHSGYAWDAIYIVANAMKKAGVEPAKLRDAIEQTKGYVGVSGIYNLTPEDHNGLGADSMIMVRVKDGKWELLK
ncbi:MAG: ABC transporter substrate-binding protein [Syntrophaceae bacterium]|jgi:branched-chain amino acid transport system substrate-binding protein|nr:ABC transporter substrate-binding protein [Syntrophaceae bacterium]